MRWYLVAAMMFLANAVAIALENESDRPSSVSVIQNEDGEARVLFRLDAVAPAERTAVARATLSFTPSGAASEKTLRLRVHPVTRPWIDGAVDWDSGWTRPGGDFNDDVYVSFEVDLREASRTVSIDLTPLVKEVVESGLTAEGFIVTPDPEEAVGIANEDSGAFDGWGEGTLTLVTRRVPTRVPAGRGGEGSR